ncbi:hypothetical protein LCGC14_0614030 [marine sediment metagenome]|uniref:Uncharacterized protein n=1 Tax=marine sediment metagenome TaxID=412755 RepID=A0A0F9UFD9_9ZZZZ
MDEGDKCLKCGNGKLVYPENYSCYINPLWAACVDKVLECEECGWEEREE